MTVYNNNGSIYSRKRQKYEDFLSNVKILSSMDPYERSRLGDALKEEKYKKGDYVIEEGQIGDKFYFISEGEAIATKQIEAGKPAQQVLQYSKGGYFGERALLTNEARAANVIATVRTKEKEYLSCFVNHMYLYSLRNSS